MCTFLVYSQNIWGFIVFKEGKNLDPKKIEAIINTPISTTPQEIQVFNGMT
jgi:hypothetical protein